MYLLIAIMQVLVISEPSDKKLEKRTNEWLLLSGIKRKDLIDLKFSTSDCMRSILIIYDVESAK